MMRPDSLRCGILLAVLTIGNLVPAAWPCSLCGPQLKEQRTFREDMQQARAIVLGHVANPRFINDNLGTGKTDLRIEKVLKYDAALGNTKVVELDRYIPVLDEKNPPRFVMFCDVVQGKLDPYRGRSVPAEPSPAILEYVKSIDSIKDKDRAEQLLFYFRHFDAADETVAEDAFLEFARASDREVGEITRRLEPTRLRKLLTDPKTDEDRLSLFAFLLGGCGGEADAALLRKLIDAPNRDDRNLDGLLCGYINLRPREGWEMTYKILSDPEQPFLAQYAAVRTLRLYHGWKPEESRPQVLRCFDAVVRDGEIADLAIEDLRRWKLWDLTPVVLPQFNNPTHKAPIARRAIVRYAVSCPTPEARTFVEMLEQQPEHRELLRDVRNGLAAERD